MKKTKILILGTFHMASFRDINNTKIDDLTSKRRQNEIIELVNKMKLYNPTKIAVEVEHKYSNILNESYSNFLLGKSELKINEVQQIGYRLAKELNHDKLYPIDWMEKGASIHGCGDVYDFTKKEEPQFLKLFDSNNNIYNDEMKLIDVFRSLNDKQDIVKTHKNYINMARIGLNNDYYGMGWLIWWYQRNLIIFARLAELVKNEEERIMLLIGSGHIGILSSILKDSGMFEVVDTLDYLKDN